MTSPHVDHDPGLAGVPVIRVRTEIQRLRRLARSDDEQDGIELFAALCDYLDELSGPAGFDRLLSPPERETMAAAITRARVQSDSGPDPVVRLDQPINAAVSVADGRGLARRLSRSGDWQAGLGVSLMALYDYLDDLHGGRDRFTVLLNSQERRLVAAERRAVPTIDRSP
ncbi:hypothetical protein [Microlunatus soli]|uniref:Uncharacterized protein n=1 Tax=Microlunatus soli TaxID=630515 RepID=A0A1H1P4H7_9ACTN|nr:hypothetical protein [Microlunatus soli]SDS06112.1 hypothetical protein SAMN04489812_0760 [Microlunatus soli]